MAFGNIAVMGKDAWQECEGSWDRLRWARMNRTKFDTAEDAAKSLGMKPNTYRNFERQPGGSRHKPLDHQHAASFARKFKVNWIWLLTGEGSPDTPSLTPAQERALAAMRGASEADQERAVAVVEALLKKGAA